MVYMRSYRQREINVNYRQMKLLNDLSLQLPELEEKGKDLEGRITLLENLLGKALDEIELIKNPPKRPRGRPRKNGNIN